MQKSVIGVFDSGLGGLSITKAIRKVLPSEDLMYVGDCLNAPYGERSRQFITDRVMTISNFLIQQGAKALVIACNTATAAAIDELRTKVSVPVIGVEPALKPAIKCTKKGIVGVMATTATINSARYQRLLDMYNPEQKVQVVSMKCSGLMDCVENGDWDSEDTIGLIKKYTSPIKEAGADFVVLGCTHYPFLKDSIRKELGENVTLYDPSPAVAKEVHRQLEFRGNLNSSMQGKEIFYITGLEDKTTRIVKKLWSDSAVVKNLDI